MLTWLNIGTRNLWLNRRRSCFTLGAIAFGFAAVNLMGGFTDYVLQGLESSYVYAAGNGHLSVFKEGFLKEGALRPTEHLLTAEEIDRIRQVGQNDERILVMTPQLNFTGLLSNGKVSTIMMAVGRDPDGTNAIRAQGKGFIRKLKLYDGERNDNSRYTGIGLAEGLAEKLDFRLGSDAVILAPTVDGFMNALDARIISTFHAQLDVLDQVLVAATLKLAQELYDTSGADRLNFLLRDGRQLPVVQADLERRLIEAGLRVEIVSWEHLQESYLRIRDMFHVIFGFVFIIVFAIVILSVINTISMSVMERTRETGTLRSLGLKRSGVSIMFATEGVVLAVVGNLLGILITLIAWAGVRLAEPTWIPPNIPTRVPLEIHLVPEFLAGTFLFLVVLVVLAALVPARRAARMRIIDALGHT